MPTTNIRTPKEYPMSNLSVPRTLVIYRPPRPRQLTKYVPRQLVKQPKHWAGRGSYV